MDLSGNPVLPPTWFSGSAQPTQGVGWGGVTQGSISGAPQVEGPGTVPPLESVLPPEVSELKPPADMDWQKAVGLGLAVVAGLWILRK